MATEVFKDIVKDIAKDTGLPVRNFKAVITGKSTIACVIFDFPEGEDIDATVEPYAEFESKTNPNRLEPTVYTARAQPSGIVVDRALVWAAEWNTGNPDVPTIVENFKN